jgi:hypothetical protein
MLGEPGKTMPNRIFSLGEKKTQCTKGESMVRSFMILLLTNYNPGDLINNKKGGVCGTYEGRGEMHTEFCWGHLKKRYRLKLVLSGRIMLKLIFEK